MKKLGLICGIVCLIGIGVIAQDNTNNDNSKPDGSRLEALKIAFITKKLNLSPEEAQRFWPVYNQYVQEIKDTRRNSIQNSEPSIQTDERLLNVRKKYNSEFAKAISPQKVDVFFRSEKEFGAFVTKEIIQRKNMRTQQQPNNRRQLLKP
jgi:hypothetical protein